jgi:hypothetical protein
MYTKEAKRCNTSCTHYCPTCAWPSLKLPSRFHSCIPQDLSSPGLAETPLAFVLGVCQDIDEHLRDTVNETGPLEHQTNVRNFCTRASMLSLPCLTINVNSGAVHALHNCTGNVLSLQSSTQCFHDHVWVLEAHSLLTGPDKDEVPPWLARCAQYQHRHA